MPFGAAEHGFFRKAGSIDVAGAKRMLDICLDTGVNFVDTGDVYAKGAGEEVLGQALRGRRDRFLVATKVRHSMDGHDVERVSGANDSGLSRHHIVAACEASLQRLGVDHIDLYKMHDWDGQTPLEETLEALDSLVRSGKVRYIGCSNFSGWHIMKSLCVSALHGFQRYVSQQIYYSLQAREAEYELVPIAVDQGVGIVVWSPLAGGLLSGKYRRDEPLPEGRHRNAWGEPPVRDVDQLYDIIDVLVEIAEARGVPPAQIALSYLLGKPGVASLIIGARTEEQLVGNLKATEVELSDDERARLDEVSEPPLIYPYWHQRHISDRWSRADELLLAPRMKEYRRLLADPLETMTTTEKLPN